MSCLGYFNPYSGKDFTSFLMLFFQRIVDFFLGRLETSEIASDEIQVLVLLGVSFSAALVGTFLVLRQMTMLANALSHTILLGIVVAFIIVRWLSADSQSSYGMNIEALLIGSVITGVVTTFLTEFLNKTVKLQEDASIGLVFTTLFAIGIIFVTLFTRNTHIGTEVVMGNVDALQPEDLRLVWAIAGINLAIFIVFLKEFQATTFDASFAKSLGISVVAFNYLLMIQVSATAISAFRAVGVLMVLAFMVGPVLTARLLTNRLRRMMIFSVLLGGVSSILGVALSRHFLTYYSISLSTAGVVVCMIVLLYCLALLFSPHQGIVVQKIIRRRIRVQETFQR